MKLGFRGGDSKKPMDIQPERLRAVAEALLERLKTDGTIFSTSTASIRTCPWKTWRGRSSS
ncbi:hypothetical protein SAMN05421548_102218 [Paraburkholderia lycopersici]|uniref:Uncharacterized protein n=1 Tax=Paraburkholderia lycopersici TaxID=416944 RepID=A0A1G6HDU7_9BURK|nr:hypothetical protein SAMN05421548_102218 [Paraburkholderia lycopersici]